MIKSIKLWFLEWVLKHNQEFFKKRVPDLGFLNRGLIHNLEVQIDDLKTRNRLLEAEIAKTRALLEKKDLVDGPQNSEYANCPHSGNERTLAHYRECPDETVRTTISDAYRGPAVQETPISLDNPILVKTVRLGNSGLFSNVGTPAVVSTREAEKESYELQTKIAEEQKEVIEKVVDERLEEEKQVEAETIIRDNRPTELPNSREAVLEPVATDEVKNEGIPTGSN